MQIIIYGGLGNTGEIGQGDVVGSLVVKLDSLEVFWFHDTAAAIGISEIPESDDPVCPSCQDDRVVVKDTGCEPSHTLLLVRLSYRSRRETVLQQYYRQSYYLCFFIKHLPPFKSLIVNHLIIVGSYRQRMR